MAGVLFPGLRLEALLESQIFGIGGGFVTVKGGGEAGVTYPLIVFSALNRLMTIGLSKAPIFSLFLAIHSSISGF